MSANLMLDSGNAACALAVKAVNPDVIAAYPITPQTSVMEKLAAYIAKGELNTKFLPVESEHSALSAVAAASAAGARVFTATSSQGLLYMHEIIHYAAGGRLPIVMANVNRAINAPWCLYVDHQDTVSQRDTGWIQIYAGDNQEIYDFIILSYKLAEASAIPVMLCYDGFILSHSMAPFELIEPGAVKEYLPAYSPEWKLHPSSSRHTYANVTPADIYNEHRMKLADDIRLATGLYKKFGAELDGLTGHNCCDLFEQYRTEDAEYFVLSMGSMGVESELAVDMLREEGIAAGALRLKLFRPFPGEALSALLPDSSKLVVLDRNCAYGLEGGALLNDAKAALYYRAGAVTIGGRSVGIGGAELPAVKLAAVIKDIIAETEGA